MLTRYVDKEVRKVCPISGVSISNPNDKSKWTIHFKSEATEEQRLAARNVVDRLVFDSEKQENVRKEIRNENRLLDICLKGLYIMMREKNPALTFSDYLDSLEAEVIA